MAWFASSAIILWTVCLLLSRWSRKDHDFVDTPAFVFIGIVCLFLGVSVLTGGVSVVSQSEPAYGAIYFLMAFIPALALASPWIVHSIGVFTSVAQREIVGADNMTVRRSYDAAEKFMFAKQFDEAEREFLAGADAEKDDPEPLRRAGEAALAAGRVDGALRHFRGALSRITSDEDRASLGIRIAEIEQRRLCDAAAARRTLEGLLATVAPGKWGDYVRERLERLGP